MIRIRNELDLSRWFKKNYKKLGFSAILKDNRGRFPDFKVLEKGKKVRVELEVFSSNFILHKHPINRVDKVVCAFKDVKLGIPIIQINNVKLIDYKKSTPYSLESEILRIIEKNKVVTSNEVSKILGISWNTADIYLLKFLVDGKVERFKKEGVTIWLKK